MKKVILYFLLLLSPICVISQTWGNVGAGLGNLCLDMHQFHSRLYAIRSSYIDYWENNTWTSIPSITGPPSLYAIMDYNDTLYCAGWDSYPVTVVYKFDGTNWLATGGPNGQFNHIDGAEIRALCKYNNKLIAAGYFLNINSKFVYNIAAWDGIKWDSLGGGLLNTSVVGTVRNLCVHNNTLFAAGDFTRSNNDPSPKYVAQWNGSAWKSVSPSYVFKTPGYKPMVSFNNRLIIANVWDTINSIPMKGITAWDGTSFTSMGNSLFYDAQIGFGGSISKFWVFNNELFCGATVSSLSPDGYDSVVLKWTGTNWVQIGNDFNYAIFSLADYNNELYACGGFTSCGGINTSRIAKTSLVIGIKEIDKESSFNMYPNPTNGKLHIENEGLTRICLTDCLGQIVYVLNDPIKKQEIDLSFLSSGIYYLKAENAEGQKCFKVLKE